MPPALRAIVGDKEQVVGGPGSSIGTVSRRALLERYLAKDTTQGHYGQLLRLELDEEDAPGLVGRERPQALDLLDLGGALGVDPEFIGSKVVEQVVHVIKGVAGDRPAHLVAQVGNKLVESLNAGEHGAVVGRHRPNPR